MPIVELSLDPSFGQKALERAIQRFGLDPEPLEQLLSIERAGAINGDPDECRFRDVILSGQRTADFFLRSGAVQCGLAATRLVHKARADEVCEDAAHVGFAVARESREHFPTTDHALLLNVAEHHFPERLAALRPRFGEPLDLLLIGAKRQPEHVRDDLPAQTLALELGHQVQEHLIRDVRKRRPEPPRRRELSDQDRGLPHDRVDE
jgi:hypothetical protein